MRLVELTIRNFRGFGPAVETVDLSGDLVLLYGPNGHGKTSLAEAIEWLFYGTTKRRQRGEVFSKAEYSGTFANAHGHSPTEVSLRALVAGRQVTLARRLGDKDASITLVDGQPADFSTVGILPLEAHYPVVAQHGLQTFVHSKPKDRRDAICAALGLDELTALKSALESARGSFQRTPPSVVVTARKQLGELAPGLAKTPSLAKIAQRWSSSSPVVEAPGDEEALLAAAADLTDEPVTAAAAALAALRLAREQAGKSVFDLSLIEPLAEHGLLRKEAAERVNSLAVASGAVDDALGVLVAVAAAAYSSALLGFWKKGLELAPLGDDCPMCEAPTLTRMQRETLGARIRDSAGTVEADAALGRALETWEKEVASLGKAVAALGLSGTDQTGLTRLKELLGDTDKLEGFVEAHESLLEARRAFGHVLRQSNDLGKNTRDRSAKAEELPELIKDRQAARDEVASAGATFFEALDAYVAAWGTISEDVAAKIAADDAVAQIDAIGKAIKAVPNVELLARYAAVLEDGQTLIRAVEATAQAKQELLLQSRGQEFKDLYALLNPGALVGFETMEPANDSLKLHATSFGVRMPAAANLSECQLNCLGLAVWLMRATTPSSPFGFILLDDPVQAMDDDHAEAFIAQVVPHLLDHEGKQIIVLSHVRNVIDKLRHMNLQRDVRHYHIENFEIGGPVIVRQFRLQQALAEIKGGADGNEAYRAYAVDRLRVLVETFVRELHLRATGVPPPPNYDTASSGQLADLFRAIPGTDPSEHAGLKDTIRFCDPAHHTQAGYSVPLKSNIQPHIDRISGLMKKYGLIQ